MKTLEGLEGLQGTDSDSVRNIQIINNLILSNISALSGLFKCQPDGGTELNATMVIGLVAAHPLPLQPIGHGCSLATPGTLCKYIADSTQCPEGTEYVRNNDGTIERVFHKATGTVTDPAGSELPAPSLGPSLVPAQAPLPELPLSPDRL